MVRHFPVIILVVLTTALGSCSRQKQEQSSGARGSPQAVQHSSPQTPETQSFRKYDIKSGIITFEKTLDLGPSNVSNKVVVTFDDYGAKECQDQYAGGVLKESFFSDGTRLYTTIYDRKTTFLRGTSDHGTEYRFAWEDVSPADKTSGAARQVTRVLVAGKDCDAYTIEKAGQRMTYAGWGHICLLQDQQTTRVRTILKALSVEENPVIPVSKFKPPAGFELREYPS